MPATTASQSTAIAIVGLGGLYPGAANVRQLWNNIVHGVDSLREVPESHWSIADYYDPDPTAPDKTYAKRGGFMPQVPFDPMEFGLPPNTLEYTDVLQLLSLLVARETLADAGCRDGEWFDRSRTGVVLGVTGANSIIQPLSARLQTPLLKRVARSCGLTDDQADELATRFTSAFVPWEENAFPGLLGNVVAGRIANRFDLGGINCTVDAACASSLAAVRMASDELLSGRADLMLTGGCDADNSILMYLCFSKTPALSKKGAIRPFDEDGDGTMIGEGIGMLALRRLADAERDGNRIYAVLRGLGASSDGKHKSIYAPRGEGQMVALERAYAAAGFGPEQVGLLEAHGTGTPVGDLTELTALREVYERAAAGRQSVAIGSVKSQIGHTKGAAGAAGLIKLALSLHHRVLPPTINVTRPRAALGLTDGPFYVNTVCRPWVAEPHRPLRRAAVSSFGFGGTNFHCVLEEHRRTGDGPAAGHATARVHLWHAETPEELLDALAGPPGEEGLAGHRARLAIVASTPDELDQRRERARERLRAEPAADSFELDEGVYYRRTAAPTGKVAALFAGQGSQYPAMGARTALAVPQVRAAYDAAAAAAAGEGEPLGAVVFPPPAFDEATRTAQEAALRRTEYAQPAIGALAMGQYRYLTELGLGVDAVLGHSFGELTALWAAGSIGDADAHRLAVARGRAMASRPADRPDPGAMAVVHAAEPRVAELLAGHPDVVVCNLNAPAQTVVGGGTDAVRAFVTHCTTQGVRAGLLPVAAAFHTEHVAHAATAFAAALADVRIAPPRIPVYANTAGASYGPDPAANSAVLVEQLTRPVHFAPRLRELYADGCRVFVEFGPKSVLTALARRTLAEHPHVTLLHADPGPGRDGDVALARLVARLAVLGVPLKGFTPHTDLSELVDAPTSMAPGPARPTSTTDTTGASTTAGMPRKGMAIPLSGINHVPAERRRAHQRALEAAPVVHPAPVPAVHGADESHRAESRGDSRDHLAVHRAFLDRQLQIAEQLSAVVREETRNGMREPVLAAVGVLAEHSAAISHSHAEAFRSLAHIDAGTPLAAPPAPATRQGLPLAPAPAGAQARLSAVPLAAPPRETGGPVEADGARPALAAVAPPPPAPPLDPPPPPTAPAPPSGQPSQPAAVTPEATPATAVPATAASATAAPASATSASHAPSASDPAAPGTSDPTAPNAADTAVPAAQAVQEQLLEIVSSKTGYPVEMLDAGMEIEADLGIDSIKRVEIMGALRERFPGTAVAGADELAELRSLNDIVGLVAGPMQGKAPSAAAEGDTHPKAEGGLGVARQHARLSPLAPADQLIAAYRQQPQALLAGDADELTTALGERLTADGWTVHRGPTPPTDVDGLDLVLYAPGRPADLGGAAASLRTGLLLAGRTQPLLVAAAGRGRAAFVTVVTPSSLPAAALGGLAGLVKTLAIEAPTLHCRAVELDAALDPVTAAHLVHAELHDARSGPPQVGYDAGGARWGTRLTDEAPAVGAGPTAPGPEDLLVVTGGGRGVTAACTIELAKRHRPGLLLLGRTPSIEAADAYADVPDEGLRAAITERLRATGGRPVPREVEAAYRELCAQREVAATVRAVERAGSTVTYLPVDVTDASAVATALRPYRTRITGLVHGAGTLADRLIVDKRGADVDRVLGPKLLGLEAVLSAVDPARLRHLLLFSSVAGFFGNRGQADYAMANEALNHLAAALRRAHPGTTVTALNWGAWQGGMVTPELARMFTARGVPLIPVDRGAAAFVEQFAPERAGDTVCVLGPSVALSPAPPVRGTVPDGGVTVRRAVHPLLTDPVLADHRIDGPPVLPATAALGAMADVVEQVLPAVTVVGARDVTVLAGLVLDRSAPAALDFELAAGGDGDGAVRVLVRDDRGRPRYRAVLDVGSPPPARGPAVVPDLDAGEPIDPYADGALFHGPRLRGIHRLLVDDGRRLVFRCELADAELGAGGFGTARFRPVLADLLLQAPLVWLHRHQGVHALPTRIGHLVQHHPLPDGAPFAVTVEDVVRGPAGTRCSVLATGADGQVLAELREVEVVDRPAAARWRRGDLVKLATGRVAEVFGPQFAEVDALPRRLRLPGPPYLVLSRVTEVHGTQGVYESASITVEYDVPDDAFTVDGRACLSTTLELAQAILVLLGYLGIDLHNRGRRRFRLLGGSSVFHGDLPRAGETIRYQLRIKRLVRQGEKLVFFFDGRGYRGTELFLEMDDNCAGFFTDAELAAPLGIVSTTMDERRRNGMTPATFAPLARSGRTALTPADIEHLTAGEVGAVFGDAFDQRADGLNPSLRLPSGPALMLHEVDEIDRTGGPRGLGKLTGRVRVSPDDWFFDCHFPDDPVLPGTLLVEGATQLLQVYALYLGLHLVLPDAEFQPAPGRRTHCTLRGQVGPHTGHLRYVAEITEVTLLPRPTVVADVMVYDGDKPILSLRDAAVQVRERPGTPYGPEEGGRPARFLGRRNAAGEPALLNEFHVAHMAKGDLATAMGPEFAGYRGRSAPRIPNGDFRFLHRVMDFTGERGQLSGAHMVTEYDVPADAWYATDDAGGGMPYCVLKETSLQAAVLSGYYLGGSLLTPDEDLVIRNLDGTATVLRDVDARGHTIRQESELLSTHQAVGATLQNFRYRLAVHGEVFYQGESLFGYFNAGALAKQAGMDGGAHVPPWLLEAGATAHRRGIAGDRLFAPHPASGLRLADGRLRLLDRVDIVPDGGQYGLGYVHATRRISPDDWYFPCHFHGDPVMPGSLGVESALQALRAFVVHGPLGERSAATFTLPVDTPLTWRYRGQVRPDDRDLSLDVHIKEIRDPAPAAGRPTLVIADGSVWNGPLRIYAFTDLAVAVRQGEPR